MPARHRFVRSLVVVLSLLFAPLAAGADETPFGRQVDPNWTGFYGKAGVNIGAPEIDARHTDTDAGGGFAFAGGYRFSPLLAGEVQFDFLGGSDVEFRGNDIGEAEYFGFTFNVKAYPATLIDDSPIPAWLEPYVLFGIGGGEFEVDFRNGPEVEESTFIVRLGAGLDILLSDSWGMFLDGGFHFTTSDDLDRRILGRKTEVEGVGIFTIGGFLRF